MPPRRIPMMLESPGPSVAGTGGGVTENTRAVNESAGKKSAAPVSVRDELIMGGGPQEIMKETDNDHENCRAAVRKVGEVLVLDEQGAGEHPVRAFLIYRAEADGPGDHGPTCADLLDADGGLGSALAEINMALGLPPATPASGTIRAAREAAGASRKMDDQKTEAQAAGLVERAVEPTDRAVYFSAVIGTSDRELTPEHGTDNQ